MKQPIQFNRKLLASAVGLALSGGMAGTVLAESPSNEELWKKIQEQQEMIEQQQKMIEEMRSKVQTTEQVTNKHEMQIEQAAKSVKDVEIRTAKAETADSENWFGPITSGYRDKISFTAGYTYWVPDDDARTYGISCLGDETSCSSTTNVRAAPGSQEHKSDTSNFSGGVKWTREFDTHDFAFGFNFSKMQSDLYRFSNSDDGEFQTPYGNLDSSTAGVGGTSQDDAWFLTVDGEYGWRRGGPNNIRLMAGFRGQYLDWERSAEQSLSSSQDYVGDENSTFYGIGPKVGASFERPISSSGNFSVFGGISGGVMLGHLEMDFDLSSNTTDRNDYRGDSGFAVAPFGEVEAGFGFLAAHDIQIQLGMQAGYQSDVLHTARVCTNAEDDDIRPDIPSCANNDTDSGVLSYSPFLRVNTYW